MYDYREALHEDIKNAIEENKEYWDGWKDMDKDARAEFLNEELWTYDDVTGNGSGSYTFNSDEARTNLYGNEYLVKELVSEFDIDAETVAEHFMDWEYWDVSIRCYLLGQVVWDVLDEIEEEENEAFIAFCVQFPECEGCPFKDCKTVEECKEGWRAIEQRAQQEAKFDERG